MSEGEHIGEHVNEIDAYIAEFTEAERTEYEAADLALDLSITLSRLRQSRHMSQAEVAALTGLHQQAISRLERAETSPRLATIQSYLGVLGYSLAIAETRGDWVLVLSQPPKAGRIQEFVGALTRVTGGVKEALRRGWPTGKGYRKPRAKMSGVILRDP